MVLWAEQAATKSYSRVVGSGHLCMSLVDCILVVCFLVLWFAILFCLVAVFVIITGLWYILLFVSFTVSL